MFGKKSDKKEEIYDDFELEEQVVPKNLIGKIQFYIENNRRGVIYISAGIILVTIIFFISKSIISNNIEENAKKATLYLSRIQPYYSISDYQKALYGDSSKTVRGEPMIGLVGIVDEYGSSEAGKLAALYAGNCLLGLNKAAEANEYFDKACGSDSKTIQAGAYAGIGDCYEKQKEFKEAAKNYEKAASLINTETSQSRYSLYTAICYEKAGDKEKAGQLYKEIVAKNENSEFAGYAKLGLLRLGMVIE